MHSAAKVALAEVLKLRKTLFDYLYDFGVIYSR